MGFHSRVGKISRNAGGILKVFVPRSQRQTPTTSASSHKSSKSMEANVHHALGTHVGRVGCPHLLLMSSWYMLTSLRPKAAGYSLRLAAL